jgi:DNA-binding NarL/FixJ family response regulator
MTFHGFVRKCTQECCLAFLTVGKESMPIRIVLADDHAMIRQGLKVILESEGFQVAGEASDGRDAIALCRRVRPDVAVVDISMPLLNGLDAAQEIMKERPQVRIVLLTAHTQERYVLESLRRGVTGYLLKENAADELVRAVRAVSEGAIYLTSKVSRSVLQAFSEKANDPGDPLSARERQVLQLIAEGKGMKEIGSLLGVSSRTADSDRANIMNKLRLRDTASLVRYAIRTGLVSSEMP